MGHTQLVIIWMAQKANQTCCVFRGLSPLLHPRWAPFHSGYPKGTTYPFLLGTYHQYSEYPPILGNKPSLSGSK